MILWQRRQRVGFELAAVSATLLARVAYELQQVPLAVALALVAAPLLLAYRDRALVRQGASLLWLEEGPWRWSVRRSAALAAEQLELSDDRSTQTLWLCASTARERIERWSSSRAALFAQTVARRLASVLALPLLEARSGTVFRADGAQQARALARSALLTVAAAAAPNSRDAFGSRTVPLAPLRGRIAPQARLWSTWLVLAGGFGLLRSSDSAFSAAFGLDLAGWLLGALLLCEGVRGLLPGVVLSTLSSAGFRLERLGLARELRAQICFAELSGVAFEPRRSLLSPAALRLDLAGHALRLTPQVLGLGARAHAEFARAFARAALDWCSAQGVDEATLEPAPPVLPALPPAPEEAGDTMLARVAGRLPRLAFVLAFAYVLEAFLLERGLRAWLDAEPVYLVSQLPNALGLAAQVAVMLANTLVPAALVYAAIRLVRSAPDVPGWMGAVFFMVLVPVMVPIVAGLSAGGDLFDRANLCFGGLEQPLAAEAIDGDGLRVTRDGVSRDYYPRNRRGVLYTRELRALARRSGDLVEIDGLLSGSYVLVSGTRQVLCKGALRRLSGLGEQPTNAGD